MHSDLLERAQIARENIAIPSFPLASIRIAAMHAPKPTPRRRTLLAAILAGLSIVAIATAAEVLQQTHITFAPSGGMVISSSAQSHSWSNPTDAQIRDAVAHLDFAATLPAGLPEGATPVQLGTEGTSALYIRYDLPGAQRASHHLLYIFLANPKTMAPLKASSAGTTPLYKVHIGNTAMLFRAGAEQVIMVSNGLTMAEFATIKASMIGAAQDGR